MTFYSISSYIQSWIEPPGFNFLLILIGCIVWFRFKIIGNSIMVIGVLSLWLLSMPIIAYSLINLLQKQYPILQEQQFKNVNQHALIVVLGGGDTIRAEYGYKHTVSDATLQRVNYAVYLHQKTGLPILLSGGKSISFRKSEADLMAEYLQDNFKLKAKFLEDKSLTTADESKYVLPILQKNQINEIYLVTNAWHMPRSVYIFQCAGINVLPAPMGHYVYGPGYALISFFPNMDALYASFIAAHEWIGLLWYRFHYGRSCL